MSANPYLSKNWWCQPCGYSCRVFIVKYEDADCPDAVFYDEQEARKHFDEASLSYDCFLMGSLSTEETSE